MKPNTSIDPPLHVSDLIREGDSLFDSIEGNDEARRLSVETAAKSLFYANLVRSLLSLIYVAHPGRVLLASGNQHSCLSGICSTFSNIAETEVRTSMPS